MLSNRLILIFLGIIFFLFIILTSNRIAGALRERLGNVGNIFPSFGNLAKVELSPTPTITLIPTTAPSITPIVKATIIPIEKGTPTDKIPATGPSSIALMIIGGTFILGATFRKLSSKP